MGAVGRLDAVAGLLLCDEIVVAHSGSKK